MYDNEKYKDAPPLKTITKARSILGRLGIIAVETAWKNSARDFYSVSLKIPAAGIATNGKGTSHAYALASAYGEMMERLQNQSFFRLSIDMDPDTLKYMDFYYAPDEKHISISNFLNDPGEWTKIQFEKIPAGIDINELMKEWLLVSYEKTPDDFVALPYRSMKSGSISYIPVKMISKMYMSNGMCAGNNVQEALVQGISEVVERYVNKKVVLGKIVPPDIPDSFLKKYPSIDNMLRQLESAGNFEVSLKDCSLGQKYPVVGAFFKDRENQSYFVKFGAHPKFEIAAERSMTELLQGQNVKKMIGMQRFDYSCKPDDEHKNILSIFVNGIGYYPPEIFGDTPDYEFSGCHKEKLSNNSDMLKYLCRLLYEKGFDVFIRDSSFLGFPAFHVIVPGFSEIEQIYSLKEIKYYSKYNRVKRYIRNIKDITDKQMQELIYYLENECGNMDFPVIKFINTPTGDNVPWYYSEKNLMLTALYCTREDYASALNSFKQFLGNIRADSQNKSLLTFYGCVRDYLSALGRGMDKGKAKKVLGSFYTASCMEGVERDFLDPGKVLVNYGNVCCWACDNCVLSSQCGYDRVVHVYKSLKEAYASSRLKQSAISWGS